MVKRFNHFEFIDDSVIESAEPKTFSAVVNNDDILQMYLKEIGRKKMLTKKEEMELGILIREGNKVEKELNMKMETCSESLKRMADSE